MKKNIASPALLLFAVLGLCFFQCKNRNPAVPAPGAAASAPGANSAYEAEFEAFYQLFHSDSLYQVEHILWPLEGVRSVEVEGNSQPVDSTWAREEWVMHRMPEDPEGLWRRDLQWYGETMVLERMSHKSSPFITERRFIRSGGEWILTYYMGMNTGGQ